MRPPPRKTAREGWRRSRQGRAAIFPLALLAVLPVLLPAAASSQIVAGRLTDAITGGPVGDAEVTLLDDQRTVVARTLSNTRGLFAIRLSRPGILLLTVTRIGYASGDSVRIIVPEDHTAQLDLDLQPEGIELPGIVVTATRLSSTLARQGFYDRKKRGLGTFLDVAELQKVPGRRLLDSLRRVPGILVRGGTPYITRAQGLSLPLSSQGCPPTLLLDGMPLEGEDVFDLLPLEWITGVEVYKGPATVPAQWRHMAVCGLIAVWTG